MCGVCGVCGVKKVGRQAAPIHTAAGLALR